MSNGNGNGGVATTGYRRIESEGPTQTPDLMRAFTVVTETTEERAPMSAELRAELVDELIQWASDPQAHDWARVDQDDPYEPDGYTP